MIDILSAICKEARKIALYITKEMYFSHLITQHINMKEVNKAYWSIALFHI